MVLPVPISAILKHFIFRTFYYHSNDILSIYPRLLITTMDTRWPKIWLYRNAIKRMPSPISMIRSNHRIGRVNPAERCNAENQRPYDLSTVLNHNYANLRASAWQRQRGSSVIAASRSIALSVARGCSSSSAVFRGKKRHAIGHAYIYVYACG